MLPHISVVIPAFNEERLLSGTLRALGCARDRLSAAGGTSDVLVVDNCSTDNTASIAEGSGATVIRSSARSISAVRNDGAAKAAGPVLFFLDADTLVHEGVLVEIASRMADPNVIGGAIGTEIRPARRVLLPYLRMWQLIAVRMQMAQGMAQFVDCTIFDSIRGYDTRLVMAEDIDFYWRLLRTANRAGKRILFLDSMPVQPSTRRLDTWPAWKTLLWTNPLVCVPLRVGILRRLLQSRRLWRAWYEDTVR